MVMLQARISEVKAKLSSYLARVRAGESVLVLDRNTPVAKLVPPDGQPGLLIREGAKPDAGLLKKSRVRLRRRVDVEALLRHDRDER